ncbi:MAG: MFS transporter [Verrucomicrobiota bacterium]
MLDIVSLTVAIPIMPFLLEFYLAPDADGSYGFLQWPLVKLLEIMGVEEGGFEGALLASGGLALTFSIAQFVTAPIWGRLSDHFGRKPILLWTVFGALVAQLIWVFGASLELFLLMRFVGGMMAGNISVASAAIADAIPGFRRAKAMTTIGLAYGIGYMLGPLIGGSTAEMNALEYLEGAEDFGLHPFSITAAVAAVLTLVNWALIRFVFVESLEEENRDKTVKIDWTLLTSLLAKVPNVQVRRIFLANFFFFAVFMGCEFNIVFIAIERFQFSAAQNATMYLLIGFTQIIAQFFLLSHLMKWMSEKSVSVSGFGLLILGIWGCAYCQSAFQLYAACVVMSFGSSVIFPCLSSLVSRKSATEVQGQVMGIHRSRGDVGTAFGPLVQSMIFFQMGGFWAFFIFGLVLLIPLYLITRVSMD